MGVVRAAGEVGGTGRAALARIDSALRQAAAWAPAERRERWTIAAAPRKAD